MGKITIVENTSEIAAGTRGSSLAVEAILIASLKTEDRTFSKFDRIRIENENQLIWEQQISKVAKRAKGLVKIYERLVDQVSPIVKAGDFPLIISGDHGSAGGSIAALKKAYPESRVGVVWIDAHADLHSPYTTPSGNMHGMPLATALAEDNLEMKINDVDADSKEKWDALKQVGGVWPKIEARDLVFVGARSIEEAEMDIIKRNNIPNFTTIDMVKEGSERIADKIEKHLSDCDVIYISFDVDSMDMELSRGTGTPVKDGISKHQALDLIGRLCSNEKVKMFEVVEVNPLLDHKGNLMAEMAFESIQKVVNVIEAR